MAVGALSSTFLPRVVLPVVAIVAAAAFVCACVAAFASRRSARRALLLVAAAFLFAGAGLAALQLRSAARVSVDLAGDRRIVCEGTLRGAPREKGWGVQAEVDLAACAGAGALQAASGAVRLSMSGPGSRELLPGERIRFRARFLPARAAKNPGSFSYRDYLLTRGIGAVASASGAVERLGVPRSLAARTEALRRRTAEQIAGAVAPPARAIVTALATGEQGGIDPELRQDFADSGLAHLIAISGMNVGYVAAVLYLLARFLLGRIPRLIVRFPVRQLAALPTLPALWGYVLFTGAAVSAVRAGLMLTVVLVGVLSGRRQDLPSTLAAAVVAILVATPTAVADVSFQLSVAAVAGIVAAAGPLLALSDAGAGKATPVRRALRALASVAAVTLAASAATAPIVAYHFKFVTGIGLLANLVAVPATGALLSPLVAAASAVAFLSPAAAAVLWQLAGIAAHLFAAFTRWAADVGQPLVVHFAPTPAELLLAFAALAAVVFGRRLPYRKTAAAALAALALVDAGYWRLMPVFDAHLTVTVFDVGQGDASLVRFPGGKTLLIDGGGIKGSSFDVGRHIVAQALWRMGIHRVDGMILTHPHYDHYRGLGFLAAAFAPRAIYGNGLDAPDAEAEDWQAFRREIAAAGVPLVDVAREQPPAEIGGATLRIVKPDLPAGADLNDTSLVVDIRYGATRLLFAGDLAEAGERWLMAHEADLRADFLRVGHHGSSDASSSAFLGAVQPAIAAISAGEHNRYGVPTKATLARLARAGVAVYRTDLDGAVTVTSDGEKLGVAAFVRRRGPPGEDP